MRVHKTQKWRIDVVAIVKCPKCGREALEDMVYCPYCGAPMNEESDPSDTKQHNETQPTNDTATQELTTYEAQSPKSTKKRRKLKTWVVIVIVVLVLAAIAAALYFTGVLDRILMQADSLADPDKWPTVTVEFDADALKETDPELKTHEWLADHEDAIADKLSGLFDYSEEYATELIDTWNDIGGMDSIKEKLSSGDHSKTVDELIHERDRLKQEIEDIPAPPERYVDGVEDLYSAFNDLSKLIDFCSHPPIERDDFDDLGRSIINTAKESVLSYFTFIRDATAYDLAVLKVLSSIEDKADELIEYGETFVKIFTDPFSVPSSTINDISNSLESNLIDFLNDASDIALEIDEIPDPPSDKFVSEEDVLDAYESYVMFIEVLFSGDIVDLEEKFDNQREEYVASMNNIYDALGFE